MPVAVAQQTCGEEIHFVLLIRSLQLRGRAFKGAKHHFKEGRKEGTGKAPHPSINHAASNFLPVEMFPSIVERAARPDLPRRLQSADQHTDPSPPQSVSSNNATTDFSSESSPSSYRRLRGRRHFTHSSLFFYRISKCNGYPPLLLLHSVNAKHVNQLDCCYLSVSFFDADCSLRRYFHFDTDDDGGGQVIVGRSQPPQNCCFPLNARSLPPPPPRFQRLPYSACLPGACLSVSLPACLRPTTTE